ncbi:MAG: hypothetical protein L6R39_007800, partial [Caloplaca ligustica]
NALTGLSGLSDISSSDVSNVVGLLTSAAQDVGGLGADLAGIELDTFPPADINRVVEIQNANRALYSEIKDTLKDIAQLINRPPQALQTLKKHAPAFAVGGTILGLLGKSDSVSINALPKTKATGTSPHPAAPTESEKVADDYFLTTVPGTAVKDFQNFIRTLPDKGSGPQRHYDLPLQYQTYLGHMTRLDAGIVNRNPMVGFIGLNRRGNVTIQHGCIDTSKEDGIAGRSTSRFNSTRVSTRDAANWVIKQQAGSPLHLRMLSSDPHDLIAFHEFSLNEPQYDYMYEGTEGRGAAIYVVDAGFGLTHQEFQRPEAPPTEYYNPAGIRPWVQGSHHGDLVAAFAVGQVLGVAKKATLVVVEPGDANGNVYLDEIFGVWRWIVSDVLAKQRKGKAVVNFSNSWDFTNNQHVDYTRWGIVQPEIADLWLPILVDLWMADIVTVFSAGNNAEENMGDLTPQRYANPANPMINVGAVDRQGFYSHFINNKIAPGTGVYGRDLQLMGERTVYALGDEVDILDPDGPTNRHYNRSGGTSYAAPQVAGLAAYLLTLPGLRFSPGLVSQTMKDFIKQQKRRNLPDEDGWDIAYNGVRGLLPCIIGSHVLHPKPRRWALDTASIHDYIAKIFKRQQSLKEIVIFKNGHLTDPKYSDQLPGGTQPKPTWSSKIKSESSAIQSKSATGSDTMNATSKLSKPTTTSSSKSSTASSNASPSSAGYRPSPSLPVTKQVCNSKRGYKAYDISFHEADMAAFINNTCSTHRSFNIFAKMILVRGKVQLNLTATVLQGTVTFNEKVCMDGFYTVLNDCDKDSDIKFGGEVDVGDVKYFVHAVKANPPSISTSFAATPSPAPPPPLPLPPPPPSPPKTTYPEAKDIVCYSKDKIKNVHDFTASKMYTFINNTCSFRDDWKIDMASITDDGQTNMML